MQEKKVDRRVKYSKMVIKNSFIQLMKKKPISKITIKEICEGADVNRATFYAHYQDPYDLLRQIEADLIDGVNVYLGNQVPKDAGEATVTMLEKILEYVKENAEIVDLLLNANGDVQFQEEITGIFGQQQVLPAAVNQSLSPEETQYVFLFFANGAIGMIRQWLKDGMRKSTRDMARLILAVIFKGRDAFLPS